MLTRIISAMIGIVLFFVIIFCAKIPFVVEAVVALLAVIALWELFQATELHKDKSLCLMSMAFVAIVPFLGTQPLWMSGLCFLYTVSLFLRLIRHETLRGGIDAVGLPFFFSITISFSFSSVVFLKDSYRANIGLTQDDSIFFIILAAAGAWLADAGAYFVGRFFGRHKLAPVISPNKTVEGFVGGLLTNVIGFGVAGWIYSVYFGAVSVNYPLLLIMGLVSALLGTLGDLSASYIKRACHIKDFGNIMPGHGGILDRFDSLLLVSPFLYIILRLVHPIWPIIIH